MGGGEPMRGSPNLTKVDTYTRETTVGKYRKVTDQESEPLIKWARRTMEGYRA